MDPSLVLRRLVQAQRAYQAVNRSHSSAAPGSGAASPSYDVQAVVRARLELEAAWAEAERCVERLA